MICNTQIMEVCINTHRLPVKNNRECLLKLICQKYFPRNVFPIFTSGPLYLCSAKIRIYPYINPYISELLF